MPGPASCLERQIRDFPSVTLNHAIHSRIVRSLTALMLYQSARHSSPLFHTVLGMVLGGLMSERERRERHALQAGKENMISQSLGVC